MATMDIPAAVLEDIQWAVASVRSHWDAFGTLDIASAFQGAFEDIEALDWLDYEQHGFGEGGLRSAAFAVGNVLVSLRLFEWCVGTETGDSYPILRSTAGRVVVDVVARVFEIHSSFPPQFDQFKWVVDEILARCLYAECLDQSAVHLAINALRAEKGYLYALEEVARVCASADESEVGT